MIETNILYNQECISGMNQIPDNSIDLVVTSPPYNVDIDYDEYKDNTPMDEYFKWTKEWLSEVYRTLKPDGRIALNVPVETNVKERGGRYFFSAEIWGVMKEIGFNLFGVVDLEEDSPHRVRQTAWGSWMSASGPYIYNPKECVILAYKEHRIKQEKGKSEWFANGEEITEGKNGSIKRKKVYSEGDKKEFMDLVFGRWKYSADKQTLTKATFSLDIPLKAIKILTFKDDIVMDPFAGSGTTLLGAEMLGRKWIGFELSSDYTKKALNRIKEYKEKQLDLFDKI